MKRREFLSVLAGAVSASPTFVFAQQNQASEAYRLDGQFAASAGTEASREVAEAGLGRRQEPSHRI